MRHDDTARFRHRHRNRFPVIRAERPQINQLHADAVLALDALGRLQRARDDRTIGDYGHVMARPDDLRLAERNHVVRSGIGRAAERLAVQAFVLQEQDGIVAADRGPEQSIGIERVRWEYHPHAWRVREDAFPTLRVIDGPACKIATNSDAHYGWR